MAFPGDKNLNFYQYQADESAANNREKININSAINMVTNTGGTNTSQKNNALHHKHNNHNNHNINNKQLPNIWTTSTSRSSSKSNFTSGSNDFHYIQASDINGKGTSVQNGSTSKLLPYDDQSNSQSKCSMFRGVILCLCLNLTYANVVRFPRELDRHGTAFLLPFLVIFLFVGLPIILLEIALGQFLGQGSAHSWRASPIFRGASIVGRLASWLGAISISLQGVLGMVYTGEILLKSVPFNHCENSFNQTPISGQECMQHTFLTPVWDNTLYFALLSMSLIVLWTLAAACTYSGITLRRSIISIGLVTLVLLAFQTGWETTKIINHKKDFSISVSINTMQDILPLDSGIWFNALVQVLFSTNIGIGALPVITGKFIYKGDAVRTSLTYISFNILVLVLSTTFFFTQYNNIHTLNSTIVIPELKPFTSIYDNALENSESEESALLAGIAYVMIVLITIMTISIQIYTASRLIRRHPNYVMSLTALIVAITAVICPNYLVARIFDTRIVGTLIVCALIFDIISITWVYGAKNIYTDLEFSIGRPISKLWVFLWCIAPLSIGSLLIWWSIDNAETDLGIKYIPRWIPIAISLTIIILIAFTEVYKQVDYNCCSMIREAGVSSKDWGPADPIVRHAWKQWTSVCEDTGKKDFTLRRRGTRDYTHSIKRGQSSHGANSSYATGTYMIKTSTLGRNSPKYSASIFGDSAIEEDISVANYPHAHRMLTDGIDDNLRAIKPLRNSNESRKMIIRLQPNTMMHDKQKIYIHPITPQPLTIEKENVHKIDCVIKNAPDYSSRIMLNTTPRHSINITTNKPLNNTSHPHDVDKYGSLRRAENTIILPPYLDTNGSEHICWRKYAKNAEEYSTEL